MMARQSGKTAALLTGARRSARHAANRSTAAGAQGGVLAPDTQAAAEAPRTRRVYMKKEQPTHLREPPITSSASTPRPAKAKGTRVTVLKADPGEMAKAGPGVAPRLPIGVEKGYAAMPTDMYHIDSLTQDTAAHVCQILLLRSQLQHPHTETYHVYPQT